MDKLNYNPEERYKLCPHTHKIYTKEEWVRDCLGGLPNVDMLEEQWDKLPDVTVGYDSTAETLKHIKRVSQLLSDAAVELLYRGSVHDESKLHDPEKTMFDKMTPLLKDLVYGSPEYKESLAELKVALDHHYANNTHHPEHYENDIDDMNLFDVIEMFMDWKAATERNKDGNIYKSIHHNKNRFKMSDQLEKIMVNTAEFLKY